jgi:hypothetical protein
VMKLLIEKNSPEECKDLPQNAKRVCNPDPGGGGEGFCDFVCLVRVSVLFFSFFFLIYLFIYYYL